MFPKNEGPVDRVIRIVVGLVLIPVALFFLDGLEGALPGVVVAVLGGAILMTGLTGRCLLYYLFGISTIRAPQEDAPIFRHIDRAKKVA